MEKLIRILCN